MSDDTIRGLFFWGMVAFGIYYIVNCTDVTVSEVTNTGLGLIDSIINFVL